MEESHCNVPFGYLSVLLSSLCLNDQVRAEIRARLPDHSLRSLLVLVEDFLDLHRKVDDQIGSDVGQEEARPGFVTRLGHMIARLRDVDNL